MVEFNNKILERVRIEILKILQSTKLSETETQIFRHLDSIDGSLNFSYDERRNQAQVRQMWIHEIWQLEQLSIAEEDLVRAKERTLEIFLGIVINSAETP